MQKHHYVYRITNTKENKHYYGVRSSKVEPKLDLGIKYFSSSTDKDFIQEQKENKYLFKYKIIKLFNSRKEANNFEIYIHEKFNVGINESFYNRAKSTSTGFCIEGINHSEETKSKISGTQKGTKHTAETKAKMSESKKNMSNETRAKMSKAKQNVSDETKAKLSKSNKDKPKSEEHKAKMSETAKNRTKIKCPYCEKESHISIMTRWHFDNCKLKKDI